MTVPFLNLFKKFFASAPAAPVAPMAPRPAPVEKPAGERLSKTVMPNTVRTLAPPDPFKVAAGSAGAGGRGLSPAVALAMEPMAERAISLQLSDIIEQFPGGYMKPVDSFDVKRDISLKASEIEKGMASGQPTISLASIYEQAPEIFLNTVAPGDATQVPLPYSKVMQQFETLQVRSDQMCDQAVPQVETPFLQVTIEDTQRFGTNMTPLQASALPPVKVEPATARTLSKAEPEAVLREKASARSVPLMPSESFLQSSPNEPALPTRIPFHLPPNGAGVPASERVPASSGPPVPSSPLPPTSPPKPSTPARIPFKIPPPNADLRPKRTLVPGIAPPEVEPPEDVPREEKPPSEKKPEVMIKLALSVIMKNLPAFQLTGALPEIPADVNIELPFSLVEPQLASGRVGVDPKTFHEALPETYRGLFVVDPTETPVLLPLQEVLKNLPETALKMRADQVKEEAVEHFETPFSRHADEDKRRFSGAPSDTAKPVETPAKETPEAAAPEPKDKVPEPVAEAEAAPPTEIKLKIETEKEQKSDAKEFVTRASSLAGVAACSITFADGLSLAGNLPAEIAADGLCAMAPSMLQKIDKHMADTKLGELVAVTLHCEKSPVTFFMQGNVCLTVLHSARELEPDTQEKLAGMVKELSQVYA